MGKTYNNLPKLTLNDIINPGFEGPVDVRMVVDTISDLSNVMETWVLNGSQMTAYECMLVAVKEDHNIYMVEGKDGITLSWKKFIAITDEQIGWINSIPSGIKNPNSIIIKYGDLVLGEYDGTEQLTITIPESSGGGSVLSVNGQTGAVVLDASDVGAYTIEEVDTALGNKVDRVAGSRLMTEAEGQKIAVTPTTTEMNEAIAASSGGGGTTDYNALQNKPSINGVVLEGDLMPEDLGLGEGGTPINTAVRVDIAQDFSDAQKAQGRANLGVKDVFETLPFVLLKGIKSTTGAYIDTGYKPTPTNRFMVGLVLPSENPESERMFFGCTGSSLSDQAYYLRAYWQYSKAQYRFTCQESSAVPQSRLVGSVSTDTDGVSHLGISMVESSADGRWGISKWAAPQNFEASNFWIYATNQNGVPNYGAGTNYELGAVSCIIEDVLPDGSIVLIGDIRAVRLTQDISNGSNGQLGFWNITKNVFIPFEGENASLVESMGDAEVQMSAYPTYIQFGQIPQEKSDLKILCLGNSYASQVMPSGGYAATGEDNYWKHFLDKLGLTQVTYYQYATAGREYQTWIDLINAGNAGVISTITGQRWDIIIPLDLSLNYSDYDKSYNGLYDLWNKLRGLCQNPNLALFLTEPIARPEIYYGNGVGSNFNAMTHHETTNRLLQKILMPSNRMLPFATAMQALRSRLVDPYRTGYELTRDKHHPLDGLPKLTTQLVSFCTIFAQAFPSKMAEIGPTLLVEGLTHDASAIGNAEDGLPQYISIDADNRTLAAEAAMDALLMTNSFKKSL